MNAYKALAIRIGRWLAPLLAGLAVTGGAACEAAPSGVAEPRTVSIMFQGQVTRADDREPVAGATVEAHHSGSTFVGTTDMEGRYAFSTSMYCEASCYAPVTDYVAHLDWFEGGMAPRLLTISPRLILPGRDSVRVQVDFALRAARPVTLILDGKVTYAATGSPLSLGSVDLRLLPARSWEVWVADGSTTTDADGRYGFIANHFCAVEGSACLVSFHVGAGDGFSGDHRRFENLEVAGDSLALTVDLELPVPSGCLAGCR